MHHWIPALPALALVLGCSPGPDAAWDSRGSPELTSVHICTEFYDLTNAQLVDVNNSFGAAGYTSVDACSPENILGFCTFKRRGATEKQFVYAEGDLTEPNARTVCEDTIEGTWATP